MLSDLFIMVTMLSYQYPIVLLQTYGPIVTNTWRIKQS